MHLEQVELAGFTVQSVHVGSGQTHGAPVLLSVRFTQRKGGTQARSKAEEPSLTWVPGQALSSMQAPSKRYFVLRH